MKHDKEHNNQIIRGMESISRVFYSQAVSLGFHQFIEFNGFITEYIKLIKSAHDKGIDFITTNSLPMKTYEAEYLAEKLGCIFAGTFKNNPKAWKAFLHKLEKEVNV